MTPNSSFQRSAFGVHLTPSLSTSDPLENEGGNILVIDGHPRNVAPEINWSSSKVLRIRRNFDGSEYKANDGWGFINKIKVIYAAGSS